MLFFVPRRFPIHLPCPSLRDYCVHRVPSSLNEILTSSHRLKLTSPTTLSIFLFENFVHVTVAIELHLNFYAHTLFRIFNG